MNIGVMGGSFNPFHNGHIETAKEIKKRASLDRIIFVPLNSPAHKETGSDMEAPMHRYTMAVLATIKTKGLHVSAYEILKGGVSYTYETMTAFRDEIYRGHKLFFITGNESFEKIPTWFKWEALISEFNFIINTRAGYPTRKMFKHIPDEIVKRFQLMKDEKIKPDLIEGSGNLIVTYTKPIEISGTAIRQSLKRIEDISQSVNPNVAEYISRNNLYI